MDPLRIGFSYNLSDNAIDLGDSGAEDAAVEYESQATVDAIAAVLSTIGEVIHLPCDRALIEKMFAKPVDLVFNIAEGWGTRNREGFVPTVCDMLEVEHTGSDALAMSLSLDKWFTKIIVERAGIPIPSGLLLNRPLEAKPDDLAHLKYPVIVKPNAEGTSKGVRNFSKMSCPNEAISVIEWVWQTYRCHVLIEEFVEGREIAVAVLDRDGDIIVLPIAEILFFPEEGRSPFYSYECKEFAEEKVVCPTGNLDPNLEKRLGKMSLAAFEALGCRDLARIDWRIDSTGEPYFLEINPLPGLGPELSLFPIQAATEGIPYSALIRTILDSALRRLQIEPQ